jgi:hypothetical protein
VSDRSATVEVLTRRVEQLAAGDPDSTRLVYAMVLALLLVGLLLVLLAVWMIRRTRTDPALLAPLERMSDAKWRKSAPDGRRALLDEVRPPGAAVPVWPRPSDVLTATALPPPDAASHAEVPVDPEPDPLLEPAIEPLTPSATDPSSLPAPSADVDPPGVADPPSVPHRFVAPSPEPSAEPAPEPAPEPATAAAADRPPDPAAEPVAIVVPVGEPPADGETPEPAPDDASVER